MRWYAALAAVVVFALFVLGADVLRSPRYTPDGAAYARFAARASGLSDRNAALSVRAFYERTPLMRDPRYRRLILLDPSVAFARSQIFANRLLYPWLVAALLPVAGFHAMLIVPAVSYLLFGLALFWLLAGFGRPWLAALLTIAALALPIVRELAASDLTDMLALMLWTVALALLLHGLRDRRPFWAIAFAVVSVLFVLTRPAPYMIVFPALAAALTSGAWAMFAASLASVAVFAAAAEATHAFGVREQLGWVYRHAMEGSKVHPTWGVWYRGALTDSVRAALSAAVRAVIPILAVLAWFFTLRRRRVRDTTIVLGTAALTCLAGVPLNPVPDSLTRVVFLPLIPVICAIFACAAAIVPFGKRANNARPDQAAAERDRLKDRRPGLAR